MIIKITPSSRRALDLLGVIAADQELYYNYHVAHVLEYYRYITK
jgi:hypothetical protein